MVDLVLVFRDVVEKGGFTQAARHRAVAHSTISRQVRELEEALGTPLMTRTTRTRSLTPAGEVVLAHARDIGSRHEEMLNALERLTALEAGELRVQALTHVGHALVLPAVEAFHRDHPRVTVHLKLTDEPLHFHRDGLDVALTVGLPSAERLVVRRLCDNPVCVVAAPGLLDGRRRPGTPEDLVDWPIVAYRSDEVTITRWPFERDGAIHHLDVHPTMTAADGVTLLEAVRQGAGVGYLSRFSVEADLAAGRLVELLPDVAFPAYAPVYLARADLRLVSPRVTAFEQAIQRSVRLPAAAR